MDSLLYGYNPEERIVAVQQLNDQTIRLFKRIEGKILHRDVEFFPFIFLTDKALLKEFPRKFWLKELAGDNFYRFIAAFTRWGEMWEAIHFILRQYNKSHSPRVSSYQELKEILVRNDAVRQYLLQSGTTLFKGMEFNELVRLQIDIQFTLIPKRKKGGKVVEEKILAVALTTSNGKEYILSAHQHNEHALLEHCIRRINKIDPDVIEGYDLFGTILPAIHRGCERQQVPFTIGRDGSAMHTPTGFASAGFGENEWFSYDVFGRHLVDILTIAEAKMDTKKTDQSFNLISLAKHFGVSVPGEQTILSHQIADEWNREPKKVSTYSLHLAHMVRDLGNLFTPSLFFLAQMCPFNYRMLVQLSAPSLIESMILREYVRQRHSIPKPSEGSRNINVPSEIFLSGIFSNVLYVDLEGLYSSVILDQNIKPTTDTLNIFIPLLTKLSSLYKELSFQADIRQQHRTSLSAQIDAVHNLINSFRLYLGSAKGLYNDVDQAEIVLAASREILKEVVHQIELFNATIIQFDGNGFFILPPDNILGEENENNFIGRLSSTLPKGVSLILSHRFKRILSYRRSNYAVLDQTNNIFIKGNGLISRGMERYLRVFIHRFIECLLTNDFKRLHHAYASSHTQVVEHKWTPPDFCRTEFVRMNTEVYQDEVTAHRIAPSPALEASIRSSVFVQANTKLSYYITGTDSGVDIARSARLTEEWDPLRPDENVSYYLARLHEVANKFRDFFDPTAFERIFSLDEMFGFSDEGIRVLGRKVTFEASDNKPDTEDYGIWLAEEG